MPTLSVYGDSVAYGIGAPPHLGFVPQLAALQANQAAPPKRVPFRNYGISGMTSYELASALQDNESFQAGILSGKNIAIYIGGDDLLTAAPALLLARGNAVALLERLYAKSGRAMGIIMANIALMTRSTHKACAIGTLYNPFPALAPVAEAIATYNARVLIPNARRYGIAVADIASAFEGRQALLIAGFRSGNPLDALRMHQTPAIHPNIQGHHVIAEQFANVLSS